VWDLKFSWQWKCRLLFPGMCCHATLKIEARSSSETFVTIFILCCITSQKSVILTDLLLYNVHSFVFAKAYLCWELMSWRIFFLLCLFCKVPCSLNIIILQFCKDSTAQDLQTKWQCIFILHIHGNYIYTEHNYFLHIYSWHDLISV
jgi:hypothetical protein